MHHLIARRLATAIAVLLVAMAAIFAWLRSAGG